MKKMKVKSTLMKESSRCRIPRERILNATSAPSGGVFERIRLMLSGIYMYIAAHGTDESTVKSVFENCFDGFDTPSDKKEAETLDLIRKLCKLVIKDPTKYGVSACMQAYRQMSDISGAVNWVYKEVRSYYALIGQAAAADANGKFAAKLVKRYLISDGRAEKMTFLPHGTYVRDDIDIEMPQNLAVAINEDGIEVIRFRGGSPDVVQNGSRRDASVNQCIELYAIWKYASQFFPDGTKLTASYYYLRRADDRRDFFPTSFFPYYETEDTGKGPVKKRHSGKNIVSVTSGIEGRDGVYGKAEDEVEENYNPQITAYVKGEVCTGELCDKCSFNHLCNYVKAPCVSTDSKKRTSAQALKLSSEQEEAINAF